MTKTNKALAISAFAIIGILIIALNIAIHKIKVLKSQEGTTVTDTLVVTKYDTIKVNKPIYITQKVIDTLLIPVTDTIRVNDTLYVNVPKEQKYYTKDSIYQVWVSGYRPELDSLRIYPKTTTQYVTKTIYKKPQRIGLGVSAGYGIMLNKQVTLSPYIGIGVYYRIW